MDELPFKIVKMQGSLDEVIARIENLLIGQTDCTRLREGGPLFDMRRREFVTLIGAAAGAWPLAARAQQGERIRRIGVLMNLTAEDSEGQARLAALLQGLQKLGWTDGRKTSVPRAVRPCPRGSPAPPAPRRARSGHCR